MSLTIVNDTNPIKVTGDTDASVEIYPDWIRVKSILWYKPTTTAHLLALQDKDGNTITKMYAVENVSQTQQLDIGIEQIYCDDMDSGELDGLIIP